MEIRRIFEENPNPSFDVIDAVGEGTNWPTLQALLKVDWVWHFYKNPDRFVFRGDKQNVRTKLL